MFEHLERESFDMLLSDIHLPDDVGLGRSSGVPECGAEGGAYHLRRVSTAYFCSGSPATIVRGSTASPCSQISKCRWGAVAWPVSPT